MTLEQRVDSLIAETRRVNALPPKHLRQRVMMMNSTTTTTTPPAPAVTTATYSASAKPLSAGQKLAAAIEFTAYGRNTVQSFAVEQPK